MKVFLLVLLPCFCYCQNFKKGTLIIACIAKDGIVIGVDSRLIDVYKDVDGIRKPKSYTDSCQKIFFVHQAPLAIAGTYAFGTEYPNKTIEKYNRMETGDSLLAISDKIYYFLTGIMINYNLQNNKPFLNNEFISGGYLDGQPRIFRFKCANEGIRPYYLNRPYYVSDSEAYNIFYKNYDTTNVYTAKQAAALIDKTITYFGKHFKRTVGGKVQIVIVNTNNKSEIYQNDFSKKPLGESSPHIIPLRDSIYFREIYNFKN
jgi:20S proteasome alpha/beta subunit